MEKKDRQTDIQSGRQTNRQTNRQADRHRQIGTDRRKETNGVKKAPKIIFCFIFVQVEAPQSHVFETKTNEETGSKDLFEGILVIH